MPPNKPIGSSGFGLGSGSFGGGVGFGLDIIAGANTGTTNSFLIVLPFSLISGLINVTPPILLLVSGSVVIVDLPNAAENTSKALPEISCFKSNGIEALGPNVNVVPSANRFKVLSSTICFCVFSCAFNLAIVFGDAWAVPAAIFFKANVAAFCCISNCSFAVLVVAFPFGAGPVISWPPRSLGFALASAIEGVALTPTGSSLVANSLLSSFTNLSASSLVANVLTTLKFWGVLPPPLSIIVTSKVPGRVVILFCSSCAFL